MSEPPLSQLREWLIANLNDDELRTFCQDLGVDFDGLPGQGKVAKARELVAYMDRHGRLTELRSGIDRLKEKYTSPAGRLQIARRRLTKLENQANRYSALDVPLELVQQLAERRREVARLKEQLHGTVPNLPSTLPRREPFFGRKAEIERGLAALDLDTRGWGLIIDGIGGIGKTALAVELAYLCQEQGDFDVFLFTTAKQTQLVPGGEREIPDSTTTLEGLLGEIARAIGETGIAKLTGVKQSRALLDTFKRYNGRDRRVLLIVDNLETLSATEQDQVVAFLSALPPYCKAITTSRKQVVDNAAHLRLEKLSWDAARQLIEAEMFRADTLRRALEKAGADRWHELYDAAGGSPLALHWLLGLIRMRHLSLDRVLRLLRDKHTDDSPLHQFIYREARQTMERNDWRVLSALSLFAAPASFEALLTVSNLTRLALEAALERLVAYALVDVRGTDGPYYLHPLTRQLAEDELSRTPETDREMRLRFSRYWVDFAERYGRHDKDTYQNFDRLAAAWLNLQATAHTLYALTDLTEKIVFTAGDTEGAEGETGRLTGKTAVEAVRLLVGLVDALKQFLWFRGYWNEAVQLGNWVYVAARAWKAWRDAGWEAHDLAWIHYHRQETELMQTWAERTTAMTARGGGKREQATSTRLEALLAHQQGDWRVAKQRYHSALAAFRELGEEMVVAIVLNDLGELAREHNTYAQAEVYYLEALTLAEKLGLKELQAYVTGNLGQLTLVWKGSQDARPLIEKALVLAQEVGRKDVIAGAQHSLARVLDEDGQYSEAIPLAETALATFEQLHHRNFPAARELVARLRQKVGDPTNDEG